MDYLSMLSGGTPRDEDQPGSLLYSLMEMAPQQRAVRDVGPPAGGAPPGGLLELIYGGNNLNPSSADGSHQTHLHYAGNKIGRVGRYLESLGFLVGENPKFGGVTPGVHKATGWHPKGKAIDVNYNGGGRWDNESQALHWLEKFLLNNYG